jgi:anti-anti-sigma regulatory factor
MALFSKPPTKKPTQPAAPARPDDAAPGRPRGVTARDVAASHAKSGDHGVFEPIHADITLGGESMMEWTPAQPAIEVVESNPGLCAVLENAALLYASGQGAHARLLLEQGVATDNDARTSPLAWLSLFDLLQRSDDRAAFDQFALQYVVQFERSPPAWDEGAKPAASAAPRSATGGYISISGRLTQASAGQIENLRKAVTRKIAHARLDLSTVVGFDDEGAKLLAAALAEARRKGLQLSIERPEKLRRLLDDALATGRDGGEGAWLLALELMQWMREQEPFDERAIDFAVTFEVSPPSWEPPAAPAGAPRPAAAAAPGQDPGRDPSETLVWSGVLTGNLAARLNELVQFASGRTVTVIDLTAVERIEFVGAGALLNTIERIEAQRKTVQLVGTSPIVRALLLLIGIAPRHFVRTST